MNDYINYLGEQLADHPEAVDATCDLATMYAGAEDCPKCGGETVITLINPDWGRRHCDEPFIEEPCGWCAQTGLKDGGL